MFLKPVWVGKIHGVGVYATHYGGSGTNFLYFNSKGCKKLPKKLPLVKKNHKNAKKILSNRPI
jgi:hypothetical protein